MKITPWGWYWLVVLLAVAIPETYWGLVNGANTVSSVIWGLERLDPAHPLDFAKWTPLHWGIAIALWLLFLWLSFHIPFGWLGG